MSTFYVRVYKPNFNKAYIDQNESVCDILLPLKTKTSYFSNMYFFILNKYSVKDAYFIYNDQRVFISKLGYEYFDDIIGWDQFGICHLQLWFIQNSFLSSRQYFYKTNTYQNEDIYFLPTNWITTDIIFTENSGLTKTIGGSSARVFSLGKTIISYINEYIEPEAYSSVVPFRGEDGSYKIRANNQELSKRFSNTGNVVTYYFWAGAVSYIDFPIYNQQLFKMTDDSNVEAAMVFNNQVNNKSPYYIFQNSAAVIDPFASPQSNPTYRNLRYTNKTKNAFMLVNLPMLKSGFGASFNVTHRDASPKVDVLLLARRPIIGNEVGIICPYTKLTDIVSSNFTIQFGLPKRILRYFELGSGSVNSVTGVIEPHPTAKYFEIIINDGKNYGNNYFQYPGINTVPSEPNKPYMAYITQAEFTIYYQNFANRPQFVSRYPLVSVTSNIQAAKNNVEDAYPFFRQQYRFQNKTAFVPGIRNPITGAFDCKIILEWTDPNSLDLFDVPFSTSTWIKMNPFSYSGDIGSWRMSGKYGTSFNSITKICSPKMYDQTKFNNVLQYNNQFTPYFMNDCCIVQELPNFIRIKNIYVQNNTEATADSQCLLTQADKVSSQVSTIAFNNNYAEFEFNRRWDNALKVNNLTVSPYKMGYSMNYNETIVASSQPFQNGVRIFKNFIDKKLYYRFKRMPKFIIKIPYQLWQAQINADFDISANWDNFRDYNLVFKDGPNQLTREQFFAVKIGYIDFEASSYNSLVKNLSVLYVNDFFENSLEVYREFFIGAYVPALNVTVTQILIFRYDKVLQRMDIRSPTQDFTRFYKNTYPDSYGLKNDLNNVTANFNPNNYPWTTAPSNNYLFPQTYYLNFKESTTSRYNFSSTKSFGIRTPVDLNFTHAALLCLPQLNTSNILTSLVLTSDLFETNRGQLLPSFIENTNARNIINFRRVSQVKSFQFYFNSIKAVRGRKTGTVLDNNVDNSPDIYILFK